MSFSLRVPVETNEYMLAMRLAVGAVCEAKGLDLDTAEDFKVCVNEGVLILKRSGFASCEITFEEGKDALVCSISGESPSGSVLSDEENEISFALLSALVDDVKVSSEGEKVNRIQLFKSL